MNSGEVPLRTRLTRAVVWIGKLAGTMIFEPILERTGYILMIYIICIIQTIAIIVERESE